MPDESIFSYGSVSSKVLFLAGSECSYFRYGPVISELMNRERANTGRRSDVKDRFKACSSLPMYEGAISCEAALWLHWVHRGDLDTVTHVSLLMLDTQLFDDLVLNYPAVQAAMQVHACRWCEWATVRMAGDGDEISDLAHSAQLLSEINWLIRGNSINPS